MSSKVVTVVSIILEQMAAVEGEIGGENIEVTEEDIVSLSLKMFT